MKGNPTLDPVERAILRADIAAGSRILLAVSGGADSVALTHAMHALVSAGTRSWALRVGHVNHGLRGEESDEDERFVSRLAAEMSVEAVSARPGSNISSEEVARAERYRLLGDMLDNWPGDLIVTAHAEDDQAETVLLNLLRGAGSVGLGAIQARRGRLVRPLLGVSRESILEYIQRHRLAYRVDSSNANRTFLRNRIRHEIMPALRSVSREPSRALARAASLTQVDAGYLAHEARDAARALHATVTDDCAIADVNAWRCLHPALRRAVIRGLLADLLGSLSNISAAHVATIETFLLRSRTDARLENQLPYGLSIGIHGNRIELDRRTELPQKTIDPLSLRVPGAIDLPAGRLSAWPLAESDINDLRLLLTVCGPWHALCDARLLGDNLTVRGRRPGDRIRPAGLGGSRKLQDLLVDRKISVRVRDRVTVIENSEHVVWIPGLAIDERVAAGVTSAHVVCLSFVPVQGLD